MKLTSKGRYAVMALVDLARFNDINPVSLRDISLRQGISLDYLEQIFSKLRKNEIDRVVGRASQQIVPEIKSGYIITKGEIIDRLLIDEQLLTEDLGNNFKEYKGGLLLVDERNMTCIPIWVGKRVSLMINDDEKRILKFMRGLSIIDEEE